MSFVLLSVLDQPITKDDVNDEQRLKKENFTHSHAHIYTKYTFMTHKEKEKRTFQIP